MNEKNRINGRTINIGKSGGRRKSENGSRERYGGERKTASKVGPCKAKKQWNGKRKGDGDTAGRKSNKSGNNGMNSTDIGERAVDKGNMNTNIYKKGEGHTTGKNTMQQQKNKKKGRNGKGYKERKKDKNRIKYGIQKT